MTPVTLYTVGHGSRPVAELISLLRSAAIEVLVDVRAQPHSSRNPQFNESALRASVEEAGMVYHWAGRQLGGLRQPEDGSRHNALRDPGLRAFADYMDTAGFRQAAAQLQRMASRAPVAILCAERDPDHCHRALIADYLTLQGIRVLHLIGPRETREHLLSPQARRESAELVYDRNTPAGLSGI